MQQERLDAILGEVVKAYLTTGTPVGSRYLAEQCGMPLSPASIRNVMFQLEQMGLLYAPHTSAGRAPTDLGLRYFVDSLMVVDQNFAGQVEQTVATHLNSSEDTESTVRRACHELSQLTQFAGVVTIHQDEQPAVRQIEFVPLADSMVLAVIVSEDGSIHNKLLRCDERLKGKRLIKLAHRFNELLKQISFSDACALLVQEMEQDRHRIADLLAPLNAWASAPIKQGSDLVVSGQSRLLEAPELGSLDTIRSLLVAFEEKESLLRLAREVESCGEEVRVFIGAEHSLANMGQVSMVLKRFESNGRIIGTLGVIGPKRMNYERILPVVDCTARWVGRMLGGAKS